MARIKKERDRYYKNAQKRYVSYLCSKVSDNAIITKFGTTVDLIDIIISAKFSDNRLKGEPSGDVQNLPFSVYLIGRPYNRQALACCRDIRPT